MKILLIGEFSGVHNNLKKGLISLGHEVKLAADGDGHKKFGYDFKISPYKGKVLALLNIFYFILNFKKFIGYDIVQFINPGVLPYYFFYFGIPQIINRFNKRKVYYVCGTDPAFINSKNEFDYFPFDNTNSIDYPNYNWFYMQYYNWFLSKIDIIIPSMYSYFVGYRGNQKLSEIIPLPGSLETENSPKINSGAKLKILFGILRYDFKGAKYILEALDMIKKEYGNKVEVTIVEKLPYKEYIQILKNHDILVDQCKSYDYGMNAIIGMEHGLIVLSGNENITRGYLGVDGLVNPVINIIPDSEVIFSVLKFLITSDKSVINKLKYESLDWAKKVHNRELVASKLLKIMGFILDKSNNCSNKKNLEIFHNQL